MIRKTSSLIIALVLAMLVLAACGRDEEPTPAPEPIPTEATQTDGGEGEAVPAAEVAAGEALTETAEAAPATEVTATEATTETAEAAVSEAVTESAEAGATAEVTATEVTTETAEAAASEAMTESAEAAVTAEVTATEVATETAEAEATAAVTGTDEVTVTEAAEAAGITVLSARPVNQLLNDNNAALVTVSPDGSQLAYVITEGRGRNRISSLCLFPFSSATPACHASPEEYQGYPPALIWSPDGTRVAFTENPILLGSESDIWVFSVADGEFTNLTDDGVVGSWAGLEAGTFALDILPMWADSSGDLYFWRSQPANMTVPLVLMKLEGGAGEAVEVRDFTPELAGQFFFFDTENWFMDGPTAVSPDGSKLAMLPNALNSMDPGSAAGIWIADLTDPTVPVRQVATLEDLQVSMPDWQFPDARATALQWTGDSKGFAVLGISNNIQMPMLLYYYVDGEAGTLTPVNDFSTVESREAYMTQVNELGLPPRFYSPWTGVIGSDGQTLLMAQNLGGTAAILAAPLPPDGNPAAMIAQTGSVSISNVTRGSAAEDGKVVLYGFLLNTATE